MQLHRDPTTLYLHGQTGSCAGQTAELAYAGLDPNGFHNWQGSFDSLGSCAATAVKVYCDSNHQAWHLEVGNGVTSGASATSADCGPPLALTFTFPVPPLPPSCCGALTSLTFTVDATP